MNSSSISAGPSYFPHEEVSNFPHEEVSEVSSADLRKRCIHTLNSSDIDCWIRSLPPMHPYSLNGKFLTFLVELLARAPYGEGGVLLLKSMENVGWFPTTHPQLYDMLLRICAPLGETAAVNKIMELAGGYQEWISQEAQKFLNNMQSLADDIETQKLHDEGTVAVGKLTDGLLNGPGRITEANGMIKQGIFKDGMLHGEGFYTVTQREIFNEHDKLVEGGPGILYGHFSNGCLIYAEWINPDGSQTMLS